MWKMLFSIMRFKFFPLSPRFWAEHSIHEKYDLLGTYFTD